MVVVKKKLLSIILHIKMFKKKKAKNKFRNLSEEGENAAEIDTKT